MCRRQFLTDEEFHAHTSIHGQQTLTPVLRNLDNDPDKKPTRCALHTFESTLIRAWRCLGCGLETSSSGTFDENHPPKCWNNPEKKTGLDLVTTWVTDADEMKRAGFECRICFSSISKGHIARAHVRQEHDRDADGHYPRMGLRSCALSLGVASLSRSSSPWPFIAIVGTAGNLGLTALENVEYLYLPGVPNDPLLGNSSNQGPASEDASPADAMGPLAEEESQDAEISDLDSTSASEDGTPTPQAKTDLESPVIARENPAFEEM